MFDAYSKYIEKFSIKIADFNPIDLTAYILLFEILPKCNNRIINIQNDNDQYFRWYILGALYLIKVYLEKNSHQLYRDFVKEFNMNNILISVLISIPVYKKFKKNNSKISLCIYEQYNQNECLKFYYVSEKRRDKYKQINFLVIIKKDRSYYCIIKDLNKLIYNHSKHKGQKYFC